MRNRDVARAWLNGQTGCNGRGNYRTNGSTLWSYALIIGLTLQDGRKIILNYRYPHTVSQTTSRHVGIATNIGRIETFWGRASCAVVSDPYTVTVRALEIKAAQRRQYEMTRYGQDLQRIHGITAIPYQA